MRKICDRVFDTQKGNWKIKSNDGLREETGVPWVTNFIKKKKPKNQTVRTCNAIKKIHKG